MSIFLSILLCWFITDFISGVGHWLEDVYLSPTGVGWLDNSLILPNIAHHRHPGGIVFGNYLSTNIVLIVISLTA